MENEEKLEIARSAIGQRMWNVSKGVGSYLYLDFGRPFVQYQEPTEYAFASTERALSSRRAFLMGEWRFWLQNVRWEIESKFARLGQIDLDREDPDFMSSPFQALFRDLQGQELTGVDFENSDFVTLRFDLGGSIKFLMSCAEGDESWDVSREIFTS